MKSVRSEKAFQTALVLLAKGEIASDGSTEHEQLEKAIRAFIHRDDNALFNERIAQFRQASETGYHARQSNRQVIIDRMRDERITFLRSQPR